MTSKDETLTNFGSNKDIDEGGCRYRSRASSEHSIRSDKFVMPPMSNDPERLTPVDLDDDRMSVASSTTANRSSMVRNTSSSQKFEGFEKECSYESSPSSHTENKLDLAMVPVISDQLLYDIVNKERTIEQIDVYLFVKKSLDLLTAKNKAESKLEQFKQKCAELELENRNIRESKVKMQVRVEQEEEYISNMLLKRIQKLKTDKELLALKYEQEEEFLTNDLMRKLSQLEGERDELATRLSKDQSWVVNNLLVKIRKLEVEIQGNHKSLEQLRREKVDLENSLEHEQEALFNTLGKRMDQLEAEKRRLQNRLDEVDGVESEAAGGGGSNNAEAPSTSSNSEAAVNNPPRISRSTNLNSSFSTSTGSTSSGAATVHRLVEATSVTTLANSNNNVPTLTSKSVSQTKLHPSSPTSTTSSMTSGIGSSTRTSSSNASINQ